MAEFDRRDFLKLVGAGAGAAAATGCSDHVEKLIPYVVQPEEITPGLPVYYASTCRECPAACGLHVKTREGRPIKLEGNPEHPINRGALCARGQAGIGRTYSPDRLAGPMRRNDAGELEPIGWDDAIALVAGKIREAEGRTWVLGEDPGPTASALIDRFVTAVGGAGRAVYSPFTGESLREAARQVFGADGEPRFDLEGADLILDFGSEFLDTGASPVEHSLQWAEARDPAKHPDGGARLVYVGPRLSMTASNADEWLAPRPGSEGVLALGLARAAVDAGAPAADVGGLLSGFDAATVAEKTEVPAETITRLGRALAKAKAAVALPPGVGLRSRRAVHTAGAVLVLDQVLGAVGSRVRFTPPGASPPASYREVLSLVQAMRGGNVGVLLIHDSNPVYSLPATAGFEDALTKVGFTVSFASLADETSALADLVLPDHTPLESWGDAAPRPGVRSLVQPSVRPLFDTRGLGDSLLDIGRAVSPEAAGRLPAGSFRSLLEESWAGVDWRAALSRGGEFSDAGAPAPAPLLTPAASRLSVVEPKLTGEGDFTLVAFPHGLLGDGRGAALPWLQEIPDNVTKIAWQSWAEISLAAAERLGVELGDVVAIETSAGSVEVPVYPRGGIRDDVVAVPLGQGHWVGHFASKDGERRGVNVASVLPAEGVDESGGRAWLTERARLTATGRSERLPLLQFSDNKRGRQLAELVPLAALSGDAAGHATPPVSAGPEAAEAGHGDAHGGGHGEGHGDGESHEIREPYDPAKDALGDYRWGMTVDLDRCTGCSACVAACYVENNVPVVGERETLAVRQMAWLRIERFVGEGEADLPAGRTHPQANGESLGDVDVRHSPMMCQHCGSAPCEPVCPVIAAYHNEEGLNGMIYNRCIGTRYCANNCPYKVRRFNYFDSQLTKWPEPMRLMLNPDVTVRGQGVMEKCTFCIQRIQSARQVAKDESRPIADGEVVVACQQACPTRAIQFGDLKDDASTVSKTADDEYRGYHALHALNTRPATTYLAKVGRGKVEA